MRHLLLLSSALLLGSATLHAQERDLAFTATDGASSTALRAGLDPSATDGIDPSLGEQEQPPRPPSGVFEARFSLAALGQGAYVDYRQGGNDFEGSVAHPIVWQLGTGTSFTLTHDLPEGVTAVLSDPFGGGIFSVAMSGEGEAALTAQQSLVGQGTLTITYTATAANSAPVFTSTPAEVGQVGVAYSYAVTTTDSDGDEVTLTAPTLPDWLTFDGTTLTGTPTEAGSFDVVLSATDGTDSAEQSFTIVVTAAANAAPSFTSTPTAIGQVGSAYSYAVTTNDADMDAVTVSATTLPSWLSFAAASGGGTLSGTPTAAGSFAVVLSATDGTDSAEQSFTIVVTAAANSAPVFTSTPVEVGQVGVAYSYAVTTTDSDGDEVTLTAPTLPDWLTLDGATLSGRPTAAGSFAVVLSATDGTDSAEQSFTIVVTAAANAAPSFTSTPVEVGQVGVAYSYTVTVTDADNDALTVTAPTLPAWLSFTPVTNGGTLAGTPTEAGSFNVVLSVTDGTDSAEQSFTVAVTAVANAAPSFTSTPTEVGQVGIAYSYAVTTNDADMDAVTVSATTLPAWLTFTPATNGGTLTGTPTEAGSFNVVLSVTDGTDSAEQSFTIVVTAAANSAPVFTSTPVEVGQVGVAYSYAVTTTDSDGDEVTLTAPTLPDWLTFDGTTLTGTPTEAGSFDVVLSATDDTDSAEQSFTVVVTPSQTGGSAERELVFTARDGASSVELRAGLDPSATDGIDAALGEAELPPLPPAGVFEARFTGSDLGQGSYRDYRTGSASFEGTTTHTLAWQLGSGTFALDYDLPDGVTATLVDAFGGAVLNASLSGSGTVEVTNAALTSATLTLVYGTPTSAAENAEAKPLGLNAPFPNPTSGPLSVSVTLLAPEHVTLSVYTAVGERVAVLADRVVGSGTSTFDWSAAHLANGLYFLRMESERETATRRLIVTR